MYIRKESFSSSCYTTSAYSVVDSPIRVESSDLAYSSITSWLGNETGGENFSNSSSRHGASLLVLDPDATHHTPQSEFWTERKTNPKSEVAQWRYCRLMGCKVPPGNWVTLEAVFSLMDIVSINDKKLIRRHQTQTWHQCRTLRCITINSTQYCSQ